LPVCCLVDVIALAKLIQALINVQDKTDEK